MLTGVLSTVVIMENVANVRYNDSFAAVSLWEKYSATFIDFGTLLLKDVAQSLLSKLVTVVGQ